MVVGPFISYCALIQPVASIPNIPQINTTLGNAKLRRPDRADDGVARALRLNELLQKATVLAAIEEKTMETSAVEILDAGIVVIARSAARAGTERRRTSTRSTRPPDVTGGRRGRGGRGGRGGGGGWCWCWEWLVVLLLESIGQSQVVGDNVSRERLLGKLLLDAPAEQIVLALFQDFARLGRSEIPGTRTRSLVHDSLGQVPRWCMLRVVVRVVPFLLRPGGGQLVLGPKEEKELVRHAIPS